MDECIRISFSQNRTHKLSQRIHPSIYTAVRFVMTEVRKPGGSGSGHTKMHHCSLFRRLAEHTTPWLKLLYLNANIRFIHHTPVEFRSVLIPLKVNLEVNLLSILVHH